MMALEHVCNINMFIGNGILFFYEKTNLFSTFNVENGHFG